MQLPVEASIHVTRTAVALLDCQLSAQWCVWHIHLALQGLAQHYDDFHGAANIVPGGTQFREQFILRDFFSRKSPVSCPETPKSLILTAPSADSKTLAALMSRCTRCSPCRYTSAFKTWRRIWAISGSPRGRSSSCKTHTVTVQHEVPVTNHNESTKVAHIHDRKLSSAHFLASI